MGLIEESEYTARKTILVDEISGVMYPLYLNEPPLFSFTPL